jgi:hypothetical protein
VPPHGNERCVQRHAVDERLRAVDRIEHPLEFGLPTLLPEFLADDGVARKALAKSLAHQFFGRAVGDGHG